MTVVAVSTAHTISPTGPQAASFKPKGYHKLANLQAREESVAIYRRFHDLNTLNLLSLQAEILNLRKRIQTLCQGDDESGDPALEKFSGYFLMLHKSLGRSNHEQYLMLLEIREKLKVYSKLTRPADFRFLLTCQDDLLLQGA